MKSYWCIRVTDVISVACATASVCPGGHVIDHLFFWVHRPSLCMHYKRLNPMDFSLCSKHSLTGMPSETCT